MDQRNVWHVYRCVRCLQPATQRTNVACLSVFMRGLCVCVCVCVAYSQCQSCSITVCLSVCLSANMRHGITYWATHVLHVRRTRELVLLSGTNCHVLFDCTLLNIPMVFCIYVCWYCVTLLFLILSCLIIKGYIHCFSRLSLINVTETGFACSNHFSCLCWPFKSPYQLASYQWHGGQNPGSSFM